LFFRRSEKQAFRDVLATQTLLVVKRLAARSIVQTEQPADAYDWGNT
jgi:hypothetical protein